MKKISKRYYFLIGSLIFGMFFGAGNLIFPIHLGQLAGANWGKAAIGFLLSGVLLPLLSLLAISITRSNGIYDLAKPISPKYALIFLILVHATLGPLFATPRTATVPFAMGFAPHIPERYQTIGLLIYSAIFFGIVYYFSVHENGIVNTIGKLLNPAFLIMLFIIFLLAFINPLGSASGQHASSGYATQALTNGFLEGYNTMDALAGLAFGVTVITAIHALGIKKQRDTSVFLAKSGIIGVFLIGLIYLLSIFLGAMSLNNYKLSENGGIALAQLAHHYMGTIGDALLATLATITCLTTAMGLVVAFAQDFHHRFPKISYKTFLTINCLISFLIANLGLTTIITWSTPILMFLYPLAISLIILGIASPLFQNDGRVYKITTLFTLIPAIFDMIKAFPPILANTGFAKGAVSFATKNFPFFSIGFGWITFAFCGFVIGILWHLIAVKKMASKAIEEA